MFLAEIPIYNYAQILITRYLFQRLIITQDLYIGYIVMLRHYENYNLVGQS